MEIQTTENTVILCAYGFAVCNSDQPLLNTHGHLFMQTLMKWDNHVTSLSEQLQRTLGQLVSSELKPSE